MAKQRVSRRRARFWVALGMAATLALGSASLAGANPPDGGSRHGGPGPSGPHWGGPGPGHGGPPPGAVVRRLPPDHGVYRHHGSRFYFGGGYWYRPHPRGYVVVRPPLGLFVAALPIGFMTVVLGGVTYYTYADVYYRPAPGGYVVVQPPPEVVALAPAVPPVTDPIVAAAASVTVISATLNLRSGPGYQFPVVAVLSQGMNLLVLGNAPGWLQVQTDAGQTGWVAQSYTAPTVGASPNG